MSLIPLSGGLSYLDLNFQNRPHIIATVVLQASSGVALIDPGPSSSLPTLRQQLATAGIGIADVTDILLTHIHLDHAGASGTLLKENPKIRVCVHGRGAPHMADPTKLLASAARLWGGEMDRLWGEVLPVPALSLHPLEGGERLEVGGRSLDVAYTPGHASHHVSYFSADTGLAFVGDTAGIKLVPDGYVLPPTPPPDIDLSLWEDSITAIDAWRPQTLFLTHFGPWSPSGPHLSELRDNLRSIAKLAEALLSADEPDEQREAQFIDELRRVLRRRLGEPDVQAYETAGRFDLSWKGLARYWSKRR